MPLSHRPATPADLDTCWRIVRGDRFYPPEQRATRTAFWRQRMVEEAMLSVVVEDSERPPETRLRAFSFSVFVTDEFAAEARAALPPGIAAHLQAQTLSGASPILNHAAIGRANARGGLTLVVNPFGYAQEATEAERTEFTEMMFACLFSYHAGYQIKELLLEAYGQEWALQNVAAGLKVRAGYPDYFQTEPGALPKDYQAAEHQPTLLGLTRDEVFASLGNRCFPLFLFARPQFGFRRGEQRLLSHALRGGTSEEIAGALGVTLSAVKKRWESIYARVEQVSPDLLLPRDDHSERRARRGLEKKDRLLVYLRQHPEELRPYAP